MPGASAALDALGDPTRRAVFERVLRGTSSVNRIAAGLPVSRPAVSQHLAVLRAAGLVIDRAEGRYRHYAVVPDALAQLRDYFDAFWDRALESFAAITEEQGAPS